MVFGVFLALFSALPSEKSVQLPGGIYALTLAPNSARVLLVPRAAATSVAIAAGWHVGSSLDGAATCGAAHVLEHLLAYHSSELSSAEELHDAWRRIGALPSAHTAPDWTEFKVSVKPEDLFDALELLREMLLHPAFSKADLEREKEVISAELLTRSHDPLLFGYNRALQALYGEDNYGLPTEGCCLLYTSPSPRD